MKVNATDVITPGVVHRADQYTVSAVFTRHAQPYMESIAYRVDVPGAAIVFSGDTMPSPTVRDLARGAQVLVHECTRPDEDLRTLGLQDHHSGPEGVGRLAAAAGVRTLILTHFSVDHDSADSIDAMVREARKFFDGEIIAGSDLFELAITPTGG